MTIFNEASVVARRHPDLTIESREAIVHHHVQARIDTDMKAGGIFVDRPLYAAILNQNKVNGDGAKVVSP